MKIKYKILVYISTTAILITLIGFVFIYFSFSSYREEEFQQLQNDKIKASIKLLEHFKTQSAEISYLLDEQDINDFYDEKLLVFDQNKKLIFESLDNLQIAQSEEILRNLSLENQWIETKEEEYDLIGVYIERNGVVYYAISKAYDAYGHTKLEFLRNTLIITFIFILIIIVATSIYIANKISKPLAELEFKINQYNLDKENNPPILLKTSTIELNSLSKRFNELLLHTNEVFRFQKHTIDHISHQLKTPIAVLVSELEKIQSNCTDSDISQQINQQIVKTKSLGGIINVLLEISKIESGQFVEKTPHRVDELIFDCINELGVIYPNFNFDFNYSPDDMEESGLILVVNSILIKQAFLNLLSNCIFYSIKNKAHINFIVSPDRTLKIQFSNTGNPISENEVKMLFNHFFRGNSSNKKTGYGLGLVLTKRILELHNAEITYIRKEDFNIFEIAFTLL